jgi:hypothetical protein
MTGYYPKFSRTKKEVSEYQSIDRQMLLATLSALASFQNNNALYAQENIGKSCILLLRPLLSPRYFPLRGLLSKKVNLQPKLSSIFSIYVQGNCTSNGSTRVLYEPIEDVERIPASLFVVNNPQHIHVLISAFAINESTRNGTMASCSRFFWSFSRSSESRIGTVV